MALRFRPADTTFYDLFTQSASHLVEGAGLLAEMLGDGNDREGIAQRMRDAEHAADETTHAIIRRVNERTDPVVFVLWGGYAQKKQKSIDAGRHTIIRSAHPSPLSAHDGFFGSRPFSQINAALRAAGKREIDWSLS